MAKKKPTTTSVFTSRSDKKIAVSTKIDPELKARMDKLQEELAKINDGLVFNVSEIIEIALEEAVARGEKELKTLTKV